MITNEHTNEHIQYIQYTYNNDNKTNTMHTIFQAQIPLIEVKTNIQHN